jgi:ABC-type multidrug transport system ATPase subunit
MPVEVADATAIAGDGSTILRGASLSAASGELVAILGPSGSGKSTLLEAIAGLRPLADGSVRVDGDLAYVPQDDIVHRELPLRRTLRYAASLRLPAVEVDRAVADALATLGLTDRAEVRVRDLSGGERKRASIAVELLTRPDVLLLDEPTSGLDPLARAGLLRHLRGLAAAGTTVLLSTHVTRDAESCDAVVVLGADGGVLYAGGVEAALTSFGVRTLDEIYERIAASANGTGPRVEAHREWAPRRIGFLRQCWLLTRRNAAVMRSSRLTLAIMAGSPLAVILMFLLLFRAGAIAHPASALMIAFWVAFSAFFFGLTYGLLQIVTEVGIVRRERVAGLRIGAYLASKVLTLVPVLAVVVAAMLGALRALDRLPAAGWDVYGPVSITALLCGVAGLALGLLTSATVRDPAQATLALPMLCFPQVLFSGAMLPLASMAGAGRAIAVAMSTRWAFEGIGHGLGLGFARQPWIDWAILGCFAAACLVAAHLVLTRKA